MLKNHTLYSHDIIYLKADVNYTEFYLKDGRKFTSSLTLKHHQSDERLKDFLRVNRSYLINSQYIDEYKSNRKDVRIYLINGDEIRVSRRRRIEIKERLQIENKNF